MVHCTCAYRSSPRRRRAGFYISFDPYRVSPPRRISAKYALDLERFSDTRVYRPGRIGEREEEVRLAPGRVQINFGRNFMDFIRCRIYLTN